VRDFALSARGATQRVAQLGHPPVAFARSGRMRLANPQTRSFEGRAGRGIGDRPEQID
jgi:hypothetical protein